MRQLVTLVLVVLINESASHWILPIVSNGQLLAPYGYVVHHQTVPDFVQHDTQQPTSRETLEDTGEGFLQQIPDISVEQAHLNPDTQNTPSDDAPNVIFNGPQSDGSYDFSYQSGDQSRSEKSDPQGNVEGSYSYTGPDGNQVKVTYSAGANKGYVPVGDGIEPPVQGSPEDDDSQRHVPSPEGEEEEHQGGMPYSYNYDAGLSSKTETADDQGNVQGSYTYIDGAGVKRTVTYTVKGDEGFVVSGDIHPDPGSPGTPGTEDAGRGDVGQRPIQPKVPPPPPPTKGGHPRPPPPTKGGHPRAPPTNEGEHPRPPPPAKGGRPPTKGSPPPVKGGASGWDKYPLGR